MTKWVFMRTIIFFATNDRGLLYDERTSLSLQQMGFYDRGLHCLCNKWFSMIEDFIVFATNVFYDRGLHCLCNKCFVMIEDFIVFATNGFL